MSNHCNDLLMAYAQHFYEFGPWIMEIQDQLNRRASPTHSKNITDVRHEAGAMIPATRRIAP